MPQLTCPVDQTHLVDSTTSGETSSKCDQCDGVWLTTAALESLEDSAASDDMVKGQRQYGKHEVDHKCPHCGESMIRFRYRGYKLEIEACPTEAGFWLDEKEDREIRDVMKRRGSNLGRAASAEKSWHKARRGEKVGIFQRVKQLFGFH
ncbi:MAG: zf-TFIIB domain-containing protein [Chloroflexi bacterium]|nr:zf-TFIIB domain-containing protein [Chloroflexota bacterium]